MCTKKVSGGYISTENCPKNLAGQEQFLLHKKNHTFFDKIFSVALIKKKMSDKCAPKKVSSGYISNENCPKFGGAGAASAPFAPSCDNFANPKNRASNGYDTSLQSKEANRATNVVRVVGRW